MDGLLHIYCGNGKGKTTAAMGLAIRGAGSGMKVRIVQFLKGNPTSELKSLEKIENITVTRLNKNYGFVSKMSEEDKAAVTECHNKLLRDTLESMADTDMLILDELCAAYGYGLLDRELTDRIVFGRENTEVVITGRNPPDSYIEAADYVSEINAVKHPYEKGISARKGIEF